VYLNDLTGLQYPLRDLFGAVCCEQTYRHVGQDRVSQLTFSVPVGALTWRLGDQEEGTLHVEKSVLRERESGDVRYASQTWG
jgi:hypothetical protein